MRSYFFILSFFFLLYSCDSKKPALKDLSNDEFIKVIDEYVYQQSLKKKDSLSWSHHGRTLYQEWQKRNYKIMDAFFCDSLKIIKYPSEGCQPFSTSKWVTYFDSTEKSHPNFYVREVILNDLWNNYLHKNLSQTDIDNLLGKPERIASCKEFENMLQTGRYYIRYDFNADSGYYYIQDTINLFEGTSEVYLYIQGFSGSGPGRLAILFEKDEILNFLALEAR